jgi:hypothetical protein
MRATSPTACTTRTPSSSPTPEPTFPGLLGRLQAERSSDPTLDAQLLDRVLVLRAAIRVANEELNKLSWQGDGLSGFLAEGLDREQARWVGRVVEEVASALDPEALGLKDGSP